MSNLDNNGDDRASWMSGLVGGGVVGAGIVGVTAATYEPMILVGLAVAVACVLLRRGAP